MNDTLKEGGNPTMTIPYSGPTRVKRTRCPRCKKWATIDVEGHVCDECKEEGKAMLDIAWANMRGWGFTDPRGDKR